MRKNIDATPTRCDRSQVNCARWRVLVGLFSGAVLISDVPLPAFVLPHNNNSNKKKKDGLRASITPREKGAFVCVRMSAPDRPPPHPPPPPTTRAPRFTSGQRSGCHGNSGRGAWRRAWVKRKKEGDDGEWEAGREGGV